MQPLEKMRRVFGGGNEPVVRTLFVILVCSIAYHVRLGEAKVLKNISIATNPGSSQNSDRTNAGDFGKEIFKRIDGFYENGTETKGLMNHSHYANDSENNPEQSVIENAKYFNASDENLNISLKANSHSFSGRGDISVPRPVASEQKCDYNEVEHEDACIVVTSIQVNVVVPRDYDTKCKRIAFGNRMVYFAMNQNPSVIVQSVKIRKDTLGTMTLAVVDNQFSDPYMARMMNRLHNWGQKVLQNPNSLRFVICPNGDKRLCVVDYQRPNGHEHLVKPAGRSVVIHCETLPCADQSVSNASDIQSDESHHVAWNESLRRNDVDTLNTSILDQLNLDAAFTTRRTDTLLNGTTDSSDSNTFVHMDLLEMHTNTYENPEVKDSTMDNYSPYDEVLDLGRCCYCQHMREKICVLQHEQAHCQEIDLAMYIGTPGTAFLSDVLNLGSVTEVIESMAILKLYEYCMDYTTHPPNGHVILPDCYKTCDKEIRHFETFGVPLYPPLVWHLNPSSITPPLIGSTTQLHFRTTNAKAGDDQDGLASCSANYVNTYRDPQSRSSATRVSPDVTWPGCLLILSLRFVFKFVSPVV